MADRVKSAMGGKKKSSKKKKKSGKHVHKMHISHTANGKYNVEHEFPPESGEPNEVHGINDMDELQQHVAENMGPPPQAQAAAPAPQGGGGAPEPMPQPQQG